MSEWRVKVKTVSYDWVTVTVPDGLSKEATDSYIARVVAGDEELEAEHEAMWEGADQADGPDDGFWVDKATKLKE
jgi:hypothetical protein